MVQTQGKMDKKVPTLLTADMVDSIDLLIKHRNECGIRDSNKYIFANQEDGHLNSWQILNSVSHKAGCVKPDIINSVSLRKYIATVCQVLDLNEGEIHWLSSHLAHTVKTHKDFYRLQEAAVEIGKVSKLLIAAENGTIAKYKGKSLEDIQVEDSTAFELGCVDEDIGVAGSDPLDEDLSHEVPNSGPALSEMSLEDGHKTNTSTKGGSFSKAQSENSQLGKRRGSRSCHKKLKQQCLMESYSQSDELDDSDADPTYQQSDSDSDVHISPKKNSKKRWSADEKLIFKLCLRDCIKKKIMPTRRVLENTQKQLKNRSLLQIRTRAHNIISGKQVFD